MNRSVLVSGLCALVFTNIFAVPNPNGVERLIGDCARGQRTACNKLRVAVADLTDQALLAKIAVQLRDGAVSDIRKDAVEKLTDQGVLAQVAIEDKDEVVRRAAVDRLTDQATLAKIAVEDKYEVSRRAAVGRITNQAFLAKISERAEDRFVRAVAIAALDGSNPALKRLAGDLGTETWDSVRSVARIKLAIQEPRIRNRHPGIVFAPSVSPHSLSYFAPNGGQANKQGESVTFVLSEAGDTLAKQNWSSDFPKGTDTLAFLAASVNNESLLVELFHRFTQSDLAELSTSEIVEVRKAAVRDLSDQTLLAKVAIAGADANVRLAAVLKLTDQNVLARAAIEESNWEVGSAAVRELTDQATLAKVAIEAGDGNVRSAAMNKLTDQTALAKVAIRSNYSNIRIDALVKLTDQAVLGEVARTDKDSQVRWHAIRHLTDQAVLGKIALKDEDWSVRQAAKEKLAYLREKKN